MHRVLILGGGGMLGHALWLACRDRFDAWVTLRSTSMNTGSPGSFSTGRAIEGVDVLHFQSVEGAFDAASPTVVINAVGVVKQSPAATDARLVEEVNGRLPHRLAALCARRGARLIHVSTDCVFSGRRGMYREEDEPDAEDVYGQSKRSGEVGPPVSLTIRTAFVGPELGTSHGLLEWFLAQAGGRVYGYRRAVFSGLTTPVLARLIADLVGREPLPVGIYHVSGQPIDKHRLLCLFRDVFRVPVEIVPRDVPVLDRSLDSSRFRALTGFEPPDWPTMVAGLAEIRPAGSKPAM
jgi:dTDP-4-dehydrorhamnose reductase